MVLILMKTSQAFLAKAIHQLLQHAIDVSVAEVSVTAHSDQFQPF
jgi:hypothetical protein